MIPLLCSLAFIAGLLIGWCAWTMYSKIRDIYLLVKDNLESPPGVVKLERNRPSKHQPIDLESETGGIMRLTPEQVAVRNLREREERVKRL